MPQPRTTGTRTIRPPLFVKIALLRVEEAVSRALYRSSRVNRDSLESVFPLCGQNLDIGQQVGLIYIAQPVERPNAKNRTRRLSNNWPFSWELKRSALKKYFQNLATFNFRAANEIFWNSLLVSFDAKIFQRLVSFDVYTANKIFLKLSASLLWYENLSEARQIRFLRGRQNFLKLSASLFWCENLPEARRFRFSCEKKISLLICACQKKFVTDFCVINRRLFHMKLRDTFHLELQRPDISVYANVDWLNSTRVEYRVSNRWFLSRKLDSSCLCLIITVLAEFLFEGFFVHYNFQARITISESWRIIFVRIKYIIRVH